MVFEFRSVIELCHIVDITFTMCVEPFCTYSHIVTYIITRGIACDQVYSVRRTSEEMQQFAWWNRYEIEIVGEISFFSRVIARWGLFGDGIAPNKRLIGR